MNDPYSVLGVSASASDEEIKRAYRELVKKYHPDHYSDNPLADLAEAKMKEINEAYDAIVKMRTQGGYQSAGSYGGASGQSGGYYSGGSSTFVQVRQLLNQGNLMEAERILRTARTNSAEWYYLMGVVSYRRGWMDDARQNFMTACNMDPGNLEYRQAMNNMNVQARRGGYGGNDMMELCTTICCLNCLCNSCCCTN